MLEYLKLEWVRLESEISLSTFTKEDCEIQQILNVQL